MFSKYDNWKTRSPDDERDDDEPEHDPTICEACDGTGEIIFAIWVYEHGCGFGHESSDGRPCEHCGGTGKTTPQPDRPWWMGTRPAAPNRETSLVASDDDIPF